MLENTWLTGRDPRVMVDWLLCNHRIPPEDRLLRLYAEAAAPCRTCRTYGADFGRSAADYAVFVSETTCLASRTRAAYLRDIFGNPWHCEKLFEPLVCREGHADWGVVKKKSFPVPLSQCRICRCEGPPWADVAKGRRPAWLTSQVLSLAAASLEVRKKSRIVEIPRLLVLADAIEEEGGDTFPCRECHGSRVYRSWGGHATGAGRYATFPCQGCKGSGREPSPLLAHLRGPGPHVVGCWAVDLVLGNRKSTI